MLQLAQPMRKRVQIRERQLRLVQHAVGRFKRRILGEMSELDRLGDRHIAILRLHFIDPDRWERRQDGLHGVCAARRGERRVWTGGPIGDATNVLLRIQELQRHTAVGRQHRPRRLIFVTDFADGDVLVGSRAGFDERERFAVQIEFAVERA